MASWDDVRRIALSLPETDEHASYRGAPSWRVKGTGFVWERPLGKKDLKELGELGGELPDGPVLGVRVADVGVKEGLLADEPEVFFTIPHFDGYPAVLVRVERISIQVLRELIVEAWLDRAPDRLARQYQASLTGEDSIDQSGSSDG